MSRKALQISGAILELRPDQFRKSSDELCGCVDALKARGCFVVDYGTDFGPKGSFEALNYGS